MAERWHWYFFVNVVTRCQGLIHGHTNDKVRTLSVSCPIIPVIFFTCWTSVSYRRGHKMAERWHCVVRTNVVTRWQSDGKMLFHSPSCRFSKVALHWHYEASSRMSAFGAGGDLVCVVCTVVVRENMVIKWRLLVMEGEEPVAGMWDSVQWNIIFMCCASPVKTMGSTFSTKSESPPAETATPKTNNVRCSIRTKQPMPDANELERRFTKVLVSINQKLRKFYRSSQER